MADQNLIQGAALADRAQAPIAATAISNITKSVAGDALSLAEGVKQRKAEFDSKLAELKDANGLDSQYYKQVAEKYASQRKKYITSQPAERGAMLLDIQRDKKRLEEADATMKTIAELGDSYSEYFKESEEGLNFLKAIKAGPREQTDGSVKFDIKGEKLTSEEVLKRAEANKIDDGAIEIMDNTIGSVIEEATKNPGADKPFNDAKYRRTVASMIKSSTNFNSLLSDNIFGTTSFLDDITELAETLSVGELGLSGDFDTDNDGSLNDEELKAVREFFLNENNKKEAAKELENYFTMYLNRQYDKQRGIYGGAVYNVTQEFDELGNPKDTKITSSTSGRIKPGTIDKETGKFWDGTAWIDTIQGL